MSSFKRVWTDMHIYIYFSTPGIQKMGKLPNFGVDMFFLKLLESKKWKKILVLVLTCFLKLLESKKWWKLISFGVDTFYSQTFGVDMFFSNSCKSKHWENWLVLVLTDWNLEPSAYTRIEGKIWKCKVAPKNNVFFQKGLNRHAYTHTYIYIFLNSWNPKNGKIA